MLGQWVSSMPFRSLYAALHLRNMTDAHTMLEEIHIDRNNQNLSGSSWFCVFHTLLLYNWGIRPALMEPTPRHYTTMRELQHAMKPVACLWDFSSFLQVSIGYELQLSAMLPGQCVHDAWAETLCNHKDDMTDWGGQLNSTWPSGEVDTVQIHGDNCLTNSAENGQNHGGIAKPHVHTMLLWPDSSSDHHWAGPQTGKNVKNSLVSCQIWLSKIDGEKAYRKSWSAPCMLSCWTRPPSVCSS